jgi:amino acid transporter
VAILVCAAAWAACLNLTFVKLIVLDVLLTGLSILLEFAALIALRVREPNLPRPFRVPGGLAGAIGVSVPPAALLALACVRNEAEPVGPFNALQLGLALIVLGVAVYFVGQRFGFRPRGVQAKAG